MDTNDLLQRINHKQAKLSKGKSRLANYILENYDKAAFMTASKLGKTVDVSESTVVRFAYSLGYNGYPDLQRSLQELIRNKLTSVQRVQLAFDLNQDKVCETILRSDLNNIRYTIDSIDKEAFNSIVREIGKANNIYIIGLRSASLLAKFLSYYLGFMLGNVRIADEPMNSALEQLISIGEGDLCIGISFPRYSTRTIECMNYAKENGAKLIAITDSRESPLAEMSDLSLIARSDMVSFADSLVAPLSVINALIVAVSIDQRNKVSPKLNKLEAIWKSQGVYVTKN
jgi:DNA-binding MurR/RpiR family transcriptional regulator